MEAIVIQTAIMGFTGMACAAILAIAARYLAVKEDPRVEFIAGLLPGINCGGCGFGGCAEYAKAVVTEGLDVSLCKPGGSATAEKIGKFMGVEVKALERHVAIVLCGGDDSKARRIALYNGVADCAAANLVAGGGKACRFGCIGLGTCSRACPVGAIETVNGLAIVHPELCIGCGKCISACPRNIIRLVPESAAFHVLCVNSDRGPEVKKVCSVGCIGCSLCVKAAGGKGIRMEGALATVDYKDPVAAGEIVAKCPQKTIVERPGFRKEAAA